MYSSTDGCTESSRFTVIIEREQQANLLSAFLKTSHDEKYSEHLGKLQTAAFGSTISKAKVHAKYTELNKSAHFVINWLSIRCPEGRLAAHFLLCMSTETGGSRPPASSTAHSSWPTHPLPQPKHDALPTMMRKMEGSYYNGAHKSASHTGIWFST